jgi:hypothetical protein
VRGRGTLAKSFIHFQTVKANLYASVYTPRKVNGKKDNQPFYLGRVIDKEQGLYKSKSRGLFKYTIEDGFMEINQETQPQHEEKLILDFGDAYALCEILRDQGYWDLIRSILPGWEDTLSAMVAYRVIRGGASRYAHDWWSGSYMRIVCPTANVQSQRVSEFFKELGDERTQRRFFKKYLAKVSVGQKNHGILVDSTGFPNDIDFHLRARNKHNGVISDETRLILAVDRTTKLPLLFRYNAGNVVDVTTLKSTILELLNYGVNVDFSILDAGYYSEKNIIALYAAGIRFVTRLCSNRKLYKSLVAEHLDGIESAKNAVFYRDRLLYFKKVPTELCGHSAHAYVVMDQKRHNDEVYAFMKRMEETRKKGTPDEIDKKTKGMGIFVLLSSENIDVSEILPLYYTSQTIEQVFDLYKNNADLLPLRSHGEETFRGHLMLSFIAAVVYMLVNTLLEGSKFCADGAFRILQNQKCKVFDKSVLIKEPVKRVNEIAEHLNIEIPLELPLP